MSINPYYATQYMTYETKYAGLKLKALNTEGCFEGYASLFEQEDLGRDIVLRGAFQESLRKSGVPRVKMLFQHDPNEPIGVWREIYEDARGLYVCGQLMLDVARAREVLSLMRAGALDGLSIGFRVLEGRRDPKTGIRRLKKVDLWEVSIVTFPMLSTARVQAVKSNRSRLYPTTHSPLKIFDKKPNIQKYTPTRGYENRLIRILQRASTALRLSS